MNTRTPAQNRSRADISREARLRNTAKRQGLTLTKSRRRDPLAIDYGLYFLAAVEGRGRAVPGGWRSRLPVDLGQGMTLDEVEAYLLGGGPERHEQTR